MKTSTIGYRVADFLRRHPPFQYIDEDELLALVQGGRVQFHEDGEIIFQQGQPRRELVYVVQQGVVHLVEESGQGEVLRDVRGEGDLLGIGRFLGDGAHRFTARTETDVILYTLPAGPFASMVKRHPRAARFLSTYFSLAARPLGLVVQDARGEELRLGRHPVDWMDRVGADQRPYPTCLPDTPAREVAALLEETGASAAVIVDSRRAPLGLVTPRVLCEKVASGLLPLDVPIQVIMQSAPYSAQPGLEAGEYLVRMMESESEHVLLTEDGTMRTALMGLVSRRDLTRVEAAAPLAIVVDMARTGTLVELARLRAQGVAVLASGLTGPAALRWLAPMAGAFNAAILRRVVALVEEALEAEGVPDPGVGRCWVFFGTAGRGELLTPYDLDHGLIYEKPRDEAGRAVRGYFLELGRRVSAGLSTCGFLATGKGIVAGHHGACRSLDEWQRAFSNWIGNPILASVYRATSFFDLKPVCGDCNLAEALEQYIHAKEDQHPNFVPLLANDSMAHLPPLTFFRGLVVDDAGDYADTLDLQEATLQPVADIARALALDRGVYSETSTLARLEGARPAAYKGGGQLLGEAAAAFRYALYQRARNGLTSGTDGSRVDPANLTRFEQNLLKAGFRTVLNLMEYTARRYGLVPRR